MQTGELATLLLGLFALVLIIAVVIYYSYCKKSASS